MKIDNTLVCVELEEIDGYLQAMPTDEPPAKPVMRPVRYRGSELLFACAKSTIQVVDHGAPLFFNGVDPIMEIIQCLDESTCAHDTLLVDVSRYRA